jgi:hypothetical protein
MEEFHVKPCEIWMVSLEKPADHVFCLICPGQTKNDEFNYEELSSFTELATKYGSSFDIDPWLNVACYAAEYLNKAGERLQRWAEVHKRIRWRRRGATGYGWFDPLGEYRTEFVKASMTLVDYF